MNYKRTPIDTQVSQSFSIAQANINITIQSSVPPPAALCGDLDHEPLQRKIQTENKT